MSGNGNRSPGNRAPCFPRDDGDGRDGNRTVIGYVRVSTDDQVDNGISLEEQRSRIRAYADAHGLKVTRIASDEGVSGKSIRGRAGLLSALQDLSDAEAEPPQASTTRSCMASRAVS